VPVNTALASVNTDKQLADCTAVPAPRYAVGITARRPARRR
jgi:hypothetical protein